MKKTIILILSLMIILTACGKDEPEKIEEGAGWLYSESFRADDGFEYFKADVSYPALKGGKRAETINKSLEELFNSQVESSSSYRQTALDSYNFARENDMPVYYCSYDTSCHLIRCDEKCVTVLGNTYLNMGGVHPDTVMLAVNFDKDGNKIEIDDLFSVPHDEYMARIEELVTAEIETNRADWYYENWREILMDSWMRDDFYIADEHLLIFWQPYAIGPYAAGIATFEIQWSDLEDILAEEWK